MAVGRAVQLQNGILRLEHTHAYNAKGLRISCTHQGASSCYAGICRVVKSHDPCSTTKQENTHLQTVKGIAEEKEKVRSKEKVFMEETKNDELLCHLDVVP